MSTPTPPEPVARGRYAIYEDPAGGAVLSYRPDGAAEDSHQPIPAAIWRLLMAAARGEKIDMSPVALARMMMGKS